MPSIFTAVTDNNPQSTDFVYKINNNGLVDGKSTLASLPISTATQTALNTKADNSPCFWVTPFWGRKYASATLTVNPTVNRVYLQAFSLTCRQNITGIKLGVPTAAGNVQVAIYQAPSADTPAGATLIGSSSSTALVAGAFIVPISVSNLSPANYYYVAVQCSSSSASILRCSFSANELSPEWACYFDRATFDFPATVPAVTEVSANDTLNIDIRTG